jgi:hypothetical protein
MKQIVSQGRVGNAPRVRAFASSGVRGIGEGYSSSLNYFMSPSPPLLRNSQMHKNFGILQLNIRKQRAVQHSLMNGQRLRDFGVLVIAELGLQRGLGTLHSRKRKEEWWRLCDKIESKFICEKS